MASATTALELYRDWILLLFRGENQVQKLSEIEIAARLSEARRDTSVTEVHAALQRWGEVSTTPDHAETLGSGLISPPPEHGYPSTSHTPLDPRSQTSPFKDEGLLSFIELYGLPKDVPVPRRIVEHLEDREQQRLASQRMNSYVGSNDDPYTPPIIDARVRRTQAALAAYGPLAVDPSQYDMTILEADEMEVDEVPPSSALYDLKVSPYYCGTRIREEAYVAKGARVRRSKKESSEKQRRGTSAPPISKSRILTFQTLPAEQGKEPEPIVDEAVHFQEPEPQNAIDFETQFCQSHGSNYSSKKRMRRFSTTTDEDDEGGGKRFREWMGINIRITHGASSRRRGDRDSNEI